VTAVAAAPLPDGHAILVTTSTDGSVPVLVWDLDGIVE
jgi:Tol biopolymer transport system component